MVKQAPAAATAVVDLTGDDDTSPEAVAREQRKKRRLAAITKGTKGTARSQVHIGTTHPNLFLYLGLWRIFG